MCVQSFIIACRYLTKKIKNKHLIQENDENNRNNDREEDGEGDEVNTLSRVDKYRKRKDKRKDGRIYFRIALAIFYIAIFYILVDYIKVPSEYSIRVGLEVGLFFISIIFLDLYLQAFTVISTKPVKKFEGKALRANPLLITCWVISLVYHMGLGLLSSMQIPLPYYFSGLVFSIGLLIVTLGHFFSYFAHVKLERKWAVEEIYATDQRNAYEMIRDCQSSYYWIQEAIKHNDEVAQMMKWNNFDRTMEEHMYDLQPYFQRTIFTNKDLERIRSIGVWFDNMRRVIQEHPNYRPVKTRTAEEIPLRKRRKDS
ncbi:hypothetical protein PP175_07000 [Aneurinibacillus sp. Ricciae_BoGa-3]|uniref:hypothetical protein n=1 Tax=Aneurinibacillus sp. Ricciae_BoGa-3 TaxID=3022697 RepID=UPI0023408A51|nr:hypothetical protein [Aneurinibacillus sp. Ricciae_BoGa-3]WCK55683.1 hypothetical protein PP175_07000 [Aneurinibacillus sp. Ricciae_BoGa-3]